jgi:myo-inositol catabolism protein IolC
MADQDEKLYILPFDHRSSFERLYGMSGGAVNSSEHDRIVAGKRLIFDAFLLALETAEDPTGFVILADEQYCESILLEARDRGLIFAVATEKSDQRELAFEYGTDFGTHIELFEPTFAKVLVRYNVEDDPDMNRRQASLLHELSQWLADRRTRFLMELIVPPTARQLLSTGESRDRYETELRPHLMCAAIDELLRAGVHPDLWKVEGLDRSDNCEAIVAATRRDNRENVGCIVLGRGEDVDAVTRWLQAAAPVEGYRGFAIGRTIWLPPLGSYLRGEIDRSSAVGRIAASYLHLVGIYRRHAVSVAEVIDVKVGEVTVSSRPGAADEVSAGHGRSELVHQDRSPTEQRTAPELGETGSGSDSHALSGAGSVDLSQHQCCPSESE